MELKKGYKQSEIGVIPEDWVCIKLGDHIILKNGFALKSEYFSNKGPIVTTPGNFKLSGGLKFDERKTIRFSGSYSKQMCFDNGDLIMVMTDLTPDCNLLGKSGIVETEEILLHNQRIGKIIIINDKVSKRYLNVFFSSFLFSKRMKSTATGSTVRHTSVPTIKNSLVPLPPLPEQKAIAQVLTDTDALIQNLKTLIAKKQAIKQGTMQELLTGKKRLEGFCGEWETKKLREVSDCLDNLRIPLNSSQRNSMKGVIPYCGANGIVDYVNDFVVDDEIILIAEDGGHFDEYKTRPIAYQMIGKCWVNNHAHIIKAKSNFDNNYLFYSIVHKNILDYISGGTRAKLNKGQLLKIEIYCSNNIKEQQAIAQILSDMDAEIDGLETQLHKTQALKQGMMQELLTGKTRLPVENYDVEEDGLSLAAENKVDEYN